nr:aldehyde dehydrogenase family protein [Angustibacter aerolatus]
MSDTVVDPQTDPSATWAVDPATSRRLARRVVAAPSAPTTTTRAPATGAPLTRLPTSTPDDVRVAADAARAVQRGWGRRSLAERARPLLVLHDLLLDHQTEPARPDPGLENGKARAHAFEEVLDVATLCRHYARRAHQYLGPKRRQGPFPVLSKALEPAPAQGRGRRHQPVELPADAGDRRRGAGGAGRQRRGAQARHADRADRPARGRACSCRPACRTGWCRWCSVTGRRSAARSSTSPTRCASPARRRSAGRWPHRPARDW